jgi:hypothetical protein
VWFLLILEHNRRNRQPQNQNAPIFVNHLAIPDNLVYCAFVLNRHTMATKAEIEQRLSVIRGWLESGITHSSAATMASVRFSISRSVSYDAIRQAQQTIDSSDDGPAESEQDLEPLSILATLQHHFNIAAASGDVPAMAKLVQSMDKARAWRGLKQEKLSPLQSPHA